MTTNEAQVTADVLATADLRGVFTHGSVRLKDYAELVRRGRWKAGAHLILLARAGSIVLFDGQHGVGPYLAVEAMGEAIRGAAESGAAWVWLRNGGHFGPAGHYTLQAARAGMLGLCFTNSSPAMAAWRGHRAVLGANPWSIAIPLGADQWPLVLDIANTVVARGRVRAAVARGEALPDGWALDPTGKATTDPAAALAGSLLPMGGHKGYAIAFMIEALTAAVAGAATSVGVRGPESSSRGPQRLGQAFVAVDIRGLVPMAEFQSRLRRLISQVRRSSIGKAGSEIVLPGEPEARIAQEQTELGIRLPNEVRMQIKKAAWYLGVSAPLACQPD